MGCAGSSQSQGEGEITLLSLSNLFLIYGFYLFNFAGFVEKKSSLGFVGKDKDVKFVIFRCDLSR